MNNLQVISLHLQEVKSKVITMEGIAWVRLRTYNGIPFQYRRIENEGCQIEYGSLPFRATIAQGVFQEMLLHFKGKTLLLGAVFDDPPPHSLGAWLVERLPGPNLAIYVGTILVHEEYADWGKGKEGVCLHFKR